MSAYRRDFDNFFLYIKMISNYYQKYKKRLREEASEKNKRWKKVREKYQNFTEGEKEKKCQYHGEPNKNLSEEQKKKLVEYRTNYYITYNK